MLRRWAWIAGAAAATVPWVLLRAAGWHGDPVAVAVLSGVAILGSAFLLSWAAEVAQMDVSQSLALAFLALISILPEYAVDMVFAWKAGRFAGWQAGLFPAHPLYQQWADHAGFATANMTGANRLLIGLGWPAVVLIHWLRTRSRAVAIEAQQSTELTFLALATLWSFTIPLRRQIGILDLAVLLAMFVFYIRRATAAEQTEPELTGPPLALSTLKPALRRGLVLTFFLWAAMVILASADPFAEALVQTGKRLGIEQFLLIQWLAPLASEAPEFIVASLFAFRGSSSLGMGTLISSKVNQWTLLVAMIPLVFSIGFTHAAALPLDGRQVEEVFLTSAQSLFAIAVLLNFEMTTWEAIGLAGLFITQLVLTNPHTRFIYAFIYIALAAIVIARDPARVRSLWALVKHGGTRVGE